MKSTRYENYAELFVVSGNRMFLKQWFIGTGLFRTLKQAHISNHGKRSRTAVLEAWFAGH